MLPIDEERERDGSLLISVITVSYNSEKYIEETILSVLGQTYKNVEYIIIDGGSTDGTVSIIEKYQEQLSYWVSESDTGMYNAINKGFEKASGDIMCWVNSDDYFYLNALEQVATVFESYDDVEWITGRKSIVNEFGQLLQLGCLKSFSQSLIKNGCYRGDCLWYITQEATFWRRSLQEKVGFKLNEDYMVASDYDLWVRMANYAKLYSVNALLGVFRKHSTQLSSDSYRYLAECSSVSRYSVKKKIMFYSRYVIYLYALITPSNKIIFNESGPQKCKNLLTIE